MTDYGYERQSREQRQHASAANDSIGINLNGPVGRSNSRKVANSNADQRVVIELLAGISAMDGGKKEAWTAPPMAGPSGQCPPFLADAIWEFQSYWKGKGIFHDIDGVVDPGGNALKHMARLAYRSGGSRVIPIDPPNKGSGLLSTLTGLLKPRPSNLSIADVQIGIAHSATFGKLTFEVVAGRIAVNDASYPGPPTSLAIQGLGGSWGQLISSASNAPAVGRQIHVGPGKSQQLGPHQLLGTCLLVNAWSGKAGYSTTTIIFNIGAQISLKNLNQDYALESAAKQLRDATHTCSGFATVASSFQGTGGSVSMIEGRIRRA